MLAKERRDKILERLAATGYCSTAFLARELQTAEETVRRDFVFLEKQGQLSRVHGGARAALRGYVDYRSRETANRKGKEAIVRRARELIAPGMVIGLDGGVTDMFLAKELALYGPSDVTVVTNSLASAQILASSSLKVYFLGGRINSEGTAVGGEPVQALHRFCLDLYFLTAFGLTEEGYLDQDYEETEVQRALLARAERSVALADAEKLDRRCPYLICPLARISKIYTDGTPKGVLTDALREAGTELCVVHKK